MKLSKPSIPIGFMLLQVFGLIWYVSLYDMHSNSHVPIEYIVLMIFLIFNVGTVAVFAMVYFFYREKKRVWQMPFFVFAIFVGVALLTDFVR